MKHDVFTQFLALSMLALAVLHAPAASAQPADAWTIETVAGSGQAGDLPAGDSSASAARALEVPVDQPFGIESGPDGALYITSVGQHRVLRLDPKTRQLITMAGNGKSGHAGDGGPATEALLNEPYEVRFDKSGHYMYFVEMKNHLIRRVDLHTGVITTIAGAPEPGFAGDGGPATEARFRQPHSIALDDAGNLYVADIGNHRIRAIDLNTGLVRTVAGTGEKELPQDGGLAIGNPILGPRALHVVDGTMWIALREGNSIWRMDLDAGTIHHVAGTGQSGYSGDGGSPRLATFNGPKGIAATPDGVLYVVDTENQVIRRISTAKDQIETIAGSGPGARGFAVAKGPALQAKFDRPHGIGLAPDGSLYIGDTNNHRVRWIHSEQ